MSRYYAFGLCFEVKWPCPLLPAPPDAPADVEASLGTIHTPLFSHATASWYKANEKQLMLTIPQVARFLVEEGKSIVVEPLCDDIDFINIFFLGSAVSGLLHQRGYLVLHANAISLGDEAMLIAAPVGGGKSTLAAAFIQNGYSLLSDDISAIRPSQKGEPPLVFPSYPQIKLCKETLAPLGYEISDLKAVGNKTNKYYVPMGESFCTSPLPVGKVVIMERHEGGAHRYEEIIGKAKLKYLLEHTYRYLFLAEQELLTKHFDLAIGLMEKVRWFRLLRSNIGFSAFDLVDTLDYKRGFFR